MSMDGGSKIRVFVKGAPEIVIKNCENYIGANGQIMRMTNDFKDHCTGKIQKDYADKCLRTLLVAHKDYSRPDWDALSAKNNGFETTKDME